MKWRWWYAAFPLLAAFAGCGSHGGPATAEEEHSSEGEAHVTVRTEPARLGTLTETVEGLGRCEALPDHIATLTPAVEGHVHELLVAQGDAVKKGQPIVELDKAVAQADLAEKTATRDGLKASLALLKSLPRPEERRANELAVEQAKVAVAQAKAAVDRLRPLRDRHEVSEQQLFDAEKALEQAAIQQKTAEAQLRVMMIGPRPEAVAEAEGKIKTADALVAFSQAHLDYHTIRAPIDGVLDSLTLPPRSDDRHRQPDRRGGRYAAGLRVGLAPAPVGPVGARWAGRDCPARRTPAFPCRTPRMPGKQGMAGKVAFVGRVADPQTGNLPIRVLVDNPQGRLTIGQSVQVSIIVDERKGVLQVPAAAILDLGEGPVLSVVRDGKSVVLHPEVRTPHQGWMEVSGTDLKEGEPVIVEGGYNLPEKTPVKLSDEKAEAKASERQGRGQGARRSDEPEPGAGHRAPLPLPGAESISSPGPGRTSG